MSYFFPGLCLAWSWAFPSPIHYLPSFAGRLILLPCHLDVPTMLLFDLCLLSLFWACYMLSFCSIPVTQHYHWACTHVVLGFLGPFHSFRASFLGPFHSLYLTSFLDWVLLDRGPFLLQSISYPLCGSIDTSTMPSCQSYHAIIWLVLAGPLLGMLYAFLLLNSSSPALSLGLFSCCFGLPWPISSLLGSLGPFYSFRSSSDGFISLGILDPFQSSIPMGFC